MGFVAEAEIAALAKSRGPGRDAKRTPFGDGEWTWEFQTQRDSRGFKPGRLHRE